MTGHCGRLGLLLNEKKKNYEQYKSQRHGSTSHFLKNRPRRSHRRKNGKIVHVDNLAPYQGPLGTNGLKEGAVGAVGEESLGELSHWEGR
jgi:hypothetical protein